MKAPSGFNKCSICLSEEKLTFEHIIPESLGGFLKVDIQCAKCNNDDLGRKLVSKAKRTYTVRLAIRYLKNELPELFQSIEEGQEYSVRRSDDISTTAFFKHGTIVSKAGPDIDGSIVVDQRDTENNLKSRLRKEGFTEEQIKTKLDEFNSINYDQPFQISRTLKVIKRKFVSLFPLAGDVDMDERVITLIAYNYLCITIGKTVYDDYFNEIRDFILKGTKTSRILIEQFPYNGPYKTYHKLYRETLEDRTKVTILLFGSIAYEVSFLQIKLMPKTNYIIIQDLKNKKIYSAVTIEDAKNGIYNVI
jgi:HNH endonuclease